MVLNKKGLFIGAILLVLFTVNTTATVIYARNAEATSKKVQADLDDLKITTQNKCIVRLVLSYPPPIRADEFELVLEEYDQCIEDQFVKIKK